MSYILFLVIFYIFYTSSQVTRRNFDQSLERSPVKRDERTMEGYQNQHRQELHEAGTSGAGATTADYVRETLRQYELSKPQPGILSGEER